MTKKVGITHSRISSLCLKDCAPNIIKTFFKRGCRNLWVSSIIWRFAVGFFCLIWSCCWSFLARSSCVIIYFAIRVKASNCCKVSLHHLKEWFMMWQKLALATQSFLGFFLFFESVCQKNVCIMRDSLVILKDLFPFLFGSSSLLRTYWREQFWAA